ncbi:MAG: hypothetical protein JJU11_10465 [Candidatus Sumerlaeia bacterium]|nr:hypothetical protein [Candidatus Sumerlaeia bacterium]
MNDRMGNGIQTAPADTIIDEPPKQLNDTTLEARHASLISRTKWRIADNAIRNMRQHMYLHLVVGLGLTFFLFGGGTLIFRFIFSWLMMQPLFGAPLMDRLVGLVFLIFFAMLLFSNLIITLSTTYISREVEFLMALPVSRKAIFRQKLFESIVYSSWAFALLCLPLFLSFGIERGAPWFYYPLIILLIIPFLTIPATIGAIMTMLVTSLLPARKTRTLCIGLGVLSIIAALILSRVTGIGRLLATANQQDLLQIMNALAIGNSPFLPSAWLLSALQSIAPANPNDIDLGQFLYWLGMLTATALFLFEVCRWLVPPLYYRGWCLSRDAAMKEVDSNARISPFRYIDRGLEKTFPSPTAGLISKDLKSFWRDPSQWTQLVVLFGLMIIFVANLGYSTRYSSSLEVVVADWKNLLSFFNLAATCFIMSILTTRFVYPLLSLEGRGFWTVGLAPLPRTRIVWQKFALCLLLCLAISTPLVAISSRILELSLAFYLVSMVAIVVMSTGLTSMSVGIGAMLPDFKEDNPARIANGVGGTLNVLLSLAYIGISVIALALPIVLTEIGVGIHTFQTVWSFPYYATMILFHAMVIYLPLRIGLRRWERLEF